MPLPLIAIAIAVKTTEIAVAWYYGGAAAVIVVVAGAGGTIYFMWPSAEEKPLTPEQINEIKQDSDEIDRRQQQAIIISKNIFVNIQENIHTVTIQICEQKARLESATNLMATELNKISYDLTYVYEIESLKQQLMQLASTNQTLSQTSTILSQHVMALLEENKTLKSENNALNLKNDVLLTSVKPAAYKLSMFF